MAHFAQINEQGIVTQVIVVGNNNSQNHGEESEIAGIEFCQSLFGRNTQWVQTSYNHKRRRRFAGIGYHYDRERDAFIAPQPFPSWVLDENTNWVAPTPMPNDGRKYMWNETNGSWRLIK